jgi:hypothetical protein
MGGNNLKKWARVECSETQVGCMLPPYVYHPLPHRSTCSCLVQCKQSFSLGCVKSLPWFPFARYVYFVNTIGINQDADL